MDVDRVVGFAVAAFAAVCTPEPVDVGFELGFVLEPSSVLVAAFAFGVASSAQATSSSIAQVYTAYREAGLDSVSHVAGLTSAETDQG